MKAQSAVGTISGTVTDATGAVIPNATITVTNKATGAVRTLTTAADSLYSAPALPAGDYEVSAAAQGFRNEVRAATVEAGSSTTVAMAMQVGAAQEVVNVEAASAQINYDNQTVSGTIARQSIQDIPLNGRSFLQLASIEPGVTASSGTQNTRNAPITVTVLGGGGSGTLITLDGLRIMDRNETIGSAVNFSQEIVQEFQLSAVNLDMAAGITSIGSVNIVTRSGGNDWHGTGYFFFRNHSLSAYPSLGRIPSEPVPTFSDGIPASWSAVR